MFMAIQQLSINLTEMLAMKENRVTEVPTCHSLFHHVCLCEDVGKLHWKTENCALLLEEAKAIRSH